MRTSAWKRTILRSGRGPVRVCTRMESRSTAQKALAKNIASPLKNAVLWNAEQPRLYQVVFVCGDEYICQEIGLRKIEVAKTVPCLSTGCR